MRLLTILGGFMVAAAVQGQNLQKGDYGFLYCHMSGEGEWTAYALSRDGLHYHDLLDGKEVYDTERLSAIEGGARDAYICRKSDSGKGYLMVTTDMSNRKSRSWFNYGINLLRSGNLTDWESTTFDFRRGREIFCDPDAPDVYKDWSTIKRVWAPQIFWHPQYVWPDGTRGGYMIYYSMWNPDDGEKYDRMYYSYADHSFTKLTKPRLLFDWGYATIDADINYLESDGKYHMLIKKEGGHPGIFQTSSEQLTGPYPEPDEHDFVNFEGNKKCEGSSAFQIPGEEGWRMAYIQYSTNPKQYRICQTDKYLRNFHDPVTIQGVKAPQHGSFMRLTKAEYKRLEKWGNKNRKQ